MVLSCSSLKEIAMVTHKISPFSLCFALLCFLALHVPHLFSLEGTGKASIRASMVQKRSKSGNFRKIWESSPIYSPLDHALC